MSANIFVIFLQTLIFTGFARDFKLHSHSIFLVLHHFYTISFDFGVILIFFTPNYTSDPNLHHCWYSFWQVHFWHFIFYMRHFSNMVIYVHRNLCIEMVFAPLRSVLNGCPPDIQHPITYCITLGLTLFSPNLVHPVWRRVCGCVKYRTKKIFFCRRLSDASIR